MADHQHSPNKPNSTDVTSMRKTVSLMLEKMHRHFSIQRVDDFGSKCNDWVEEFLDVGFDPEDVMPAYRRAMANRAAGTRKTCSR